MDKARAVVFNATFNNISVQYCGGQFIGRENHRFSQVTDKLNYMMLYLDTSPWIELTTLVMRTTDCTCTVGGRMYSSNMA
jgi:hypothetical protein